MKKTIGIKRNFIIIIISILLSACTKKENASQQALLLELVQAEAVMYEHPDSALGVLQGMKVPAVSDKLQNATWALLTVQAKYKNYKEELADSTLINIAYDYFMKQNNPQRKAMVLYYKGVLYEKADKKNEAQESYLKAIEEVEKTKDYQLAPQIRPIQPAKWMIAALPAMLPIASRANSTVRLKKTNCRTRAPFSVPKNINSVNTPHRPR